jgi:hypothetical protein
VFGEAIRVYVSSVGTVGDLSCSCGVQVIEARWISSSGDGRAPFSCFLGSKFGGRCQ